MKKLAGLLCALFVFAGAQAYGQTLYLACDWPADAAMIASSEVEVNGVIKPGTFVQSGVYCRLLDITNFSKGPVTFRARFISTGGWPSDWSLPFTDAKPDAPGGVYIIK